MIKKNKILEILSGFYDIIFRKSKKMISENGKLIIVNFLMIKQVHYNKNTGNCEKRIIKI